MITCTATRSVGLTSIVDHTGPEDTVVSQKENNWRETAARVNTVLVAINEKEKRKKSCYNVICITCVRSAISVPPLPRQPIAAESHSALLTSTYSAADITLTSALFFCQNQNIYCPNTNLRGNVSYGAQ